jgi:DNA polymerase III epsilon subunit-like protein
MDDPAFLAATYVVIDFESLTPEGRPPVPVEVAAMAGRFAGQRQHCPVLTDTSLLCTVRLSRAAFPELGSHRLDSVLRFLSIPVPPGRHRAMPDAELTVQVLQHALAAGHERGLWTALRDLDAAAGIVPRPAANGAGNAPAQEPLF